VRTGLCGRWGGVEPAGVAMARGLLGGLRRQMRRLQPLLCSEAFPLADLWTVCPDPGPTMVLVVRFWDREKSPTGGAGLDDVDVYGRRLPRWGAVEVLSLPLPPSSLGENPIFDWTAVAPWRRFPC
jgi:hypothetical protein